MKNDDNIDDFPHCVKPNSSANLRQIKKTGKHEESVPNDQSGVVLDCEGNIRAGKKSRIEEGN